MEMIDRYVHAVTDLLPEDTQEDVARELRTNIEDMLPEDATEKDVRDVLEKLGNPVKLSNEYRQAKRYLIGPAIYDSYLSILKLVIGIAVIVFVFFALLGTLTKQAGIDIPFTLPTGFVSDLLSAAFDGAAQAFIWVTLVFVIIERAGVAEGKLPFNNRKWSVDDLQPISANPKGKITRAEVIVSLVFTVLFTSLLLFRPELIGWYESGENGLELIAPVFNIARLQFYIPAMVLLALFQFSMSIYKLVLLRWNLPIAIANTLNNLAVSILVCLMFKDRSLFNPAITSRFADLIGESVSRMEVILINGISVFLVFFIIVCTIDSLNGFAKCRKIRGIKMNQLS